MNERIRELVRESHLDVYGLGKDRYKWESTVDKFAKLIIEECMRMCEVTEMSFVTHDCDVEASGAITVKHFIAEHFGVE
jgi:hypothetical protein